VASVTALLSLTSARETVESHHCTRTIDLRVDLTFCESLDAIFPSNLLHTNELQQAHMRRWEKIQILKNVGSGWFALGTNALVGIFLLRLFSTGWEMQRSESGC